MYYDEILDKADIVSGESIFISSDIRALILKEFRKKPKINFEEYLDGFIDALLERIGNEGTLLFPTYNWDYCNGVPFDYHNTSCKTGSLGTIALKRDDFTRTQHPLYSFAVWGKDKELLCSLTNHSSFGSDGPFGYLHHKNVKNIIIGVDYQHCFTYVHHVEEMLQAPYRYLKTFAAPYIDQTGSTFSRNYSMYVRNLDMNVKVTVNPLGEELEKKGVIKKYEVAGIPVRVLRFGDVHPYIEQDILQNRSRKLCTYIGQEKDDE